ncbi:MAG TPA: hypothetical protein VFN56_04420 [Candidatus Saccharimonadales bacterium]|nr:hypothetical protein [Candidatus Saccharimonadales bacterium]
MTATNHALTGALIGLVVGNTLVALPIALISHFVCDTIPHFGKDADETWLRSSLFKRSLAADAIICVLITVILFLTHPMHWFLAVLCAFIATSPDLYWISQFKKAVEGKKITRYTNGFGYFAGVIQWFQKPIGIVIEIAWATAMGLLIFPFIR